MRTLLTHGLVAFAAALMLPAPASAHEQAVAFTELTVKANGAETDCSVQGCTLEVAHRLAIHDAESTLMHVLGARADLYGDREAQSKFEAYVADQFSLADAQSGEAIELTLLGGEVERGYYWVYLEGELPASTTELSVINTVMMDAIENQTNRVNIRQNDMTRTLVFRGSARPRAYRIR
ncbi:MAG: DUF6702 family protein [Henriciella sp.]